MRRPAGYVTPVFCALCGAVFVAAGVAIVIAGNDLPGDLGGGGIAAALGVLTLAGAWLLLPGNPNGKPERRPVEVDGGSVRALVFPFVRGRFVAAAVCMVTLLAGSVAYVAVGVAGGMWGVAAMGVAGALLFGLPARTTVRRLRRAHYLALTPGLLCVEAPANRMNVPWTDVETIRLLDIDGQPFIGVTLRAGVDGPPRGRRVRRLNRVFGAHLFVEVRMLACPPDVLLDELDEHMRAARR
ncbi:hypothetical protein [Actinomadura sp. WMMB 499]|uniref:hypothetical protein n=1 Tax=Actinomadura sp. WMMB 499 TaxID=1219491 RepID=UPI001248EE86|nr:hypothetical protein [Actinomadura sp. WMMB 499]QFG23643.1 hypothetical protein F7P10_23480 [Actinomadura sp. WMMB 499]